MEGQEGKKEIRILIGTPRAGFTMVEAVDNQIDMASYLGNLQAKSNYKFLWATIGRLFVAKAREEFAEYAIKMDCQYLMMVDDDMICKPDLLQKLIAHDVDVVAPLAFQRREPFYPVCYIQREGWDPARKERYYANEIVKNYPKNTLFECDAVGFGAVLIKRKVLDGMLKPRFMSTNPSGEDILFCYNARQAGFKVYMDTATKIQHLGPPRIVDEKLYEEFNNVEENRKYHGEYKKDEAV